MFFMLCDILRKTQQRFFVVLNCSKLGSQHIRFFCFITYNIAVYHIRSYKMTLTLWCGMVLQGMTSNEIISDYVMLCYILYKYVH